MLYTGIVDMYFLYLEVLHVSKLYFYRACGFMDLYVHENMVHKDQHVGILKFDLPSIMLLIDLICIYDKILPVGGGLGPVNAAFSSLVRS